MTLALVILTSVFRLTAAWLAHRLFRRHREWRFAIVTFVLGVTALFPIVQLLNPQDDFVQSWLAEVGGGLAVLLTALILVRTLTDLSVAYDRVRKANDELEARVTERTAELREANASLKAEIHERRKAEEALRASEAALKRNRGELRLLAGKLIATQEDERRRLARELHDHLSQTLAALALQLAKLQRPDASGAAPAPALKAIEESVQQLADEIHDLSRMLHPSILDDLGLVAAVRTECDRFAEREGCKVHFAADKVPDDLSDECVLTLYRIAQEALHNVAKHAGASEVWLRLSREDDAVALTVEDDGAGFDVEATREKVGLGLISMTERVQLLNGRLTVESAPGEGTRIVALAPRETGGAEAGAERSTVHEQAASVAG